ncbi:MAG: TetR/AcrR family transcriptional regulator [Bacteroidales bacterium]|nr:TetR/AcrR family transcriptional regulator [Bacteroidales bacterium]
MGNESKYAGLAKHSRDNNEFTKECLKTAIKEMAKTQEYKDISVTKLCERAGVSRMAFYRNYNIVSDVYYELAYDLNNEMIAAAGSPFRLGTSKEWYLKVFNLVEKNKDSLSLMFQENFQYQWMRIVNSLAVHDKSFSQEKTFQRIMWCGGFENAIASWLKNDLTPSAEEMAEYCITYLPHLLLSDEEE